MHWTRRIRRGTNCPDTIAESVAAGLGVPAAIGLLVRGQKTTRQADLPPGSRLANIKGVFRVAKGCQLQGARVLLVDDILTTGATCNEAAKTLLSAGASDVAIAVIARAEPWK
jgi:predicted amidophosphoribosyltransferase